MGKKPLQRLKAKYRSDLKIVKTEIALSVAKTSTEIIKKKHQSRRMNEKNLRLPYMTLSEESKGVLRELFTNYPPGDRAVQEVGMEQIAVVDKLRLHKDNIFCTNLMNKEEITKKLKAHCANLECSPRLAQITEKRYKLPIASFKDEITTTVESNQVVLISGATGCGKTTQVPQFILDSMWSKCEACKVVCTQPRRISAISVAERISCERGQDIGDDIGYKIRLESKGGKHSSIVFCTNGILLRVLVSLGTARTGADGSHKYSKGTISDITHIIVDEIHERDHNCDFMLAILRDLLSSYPHLRLILMSATLDAERFSEYFGGCPVIRVPGFTYPVKTFYLEDVLSIVNSTENIFLDSSLPSDPTESPKLSQEYRASLDDAISLAWSTDECNSLLDLIYSKGTQVLNYQHSLTGLTPLMVLAGKGRARDVCLLLSLGVDCYLKANDGTTALVLAEREKQEATAEILKRHTEKALLNTAEEQQILDKYLRTANEQLIDIVLLEQLLRKLCSDSKEGGILVFLPGWYEITEIREKLLANPYFGNDSQFIILPLHSMVPSMDQKKVFDRPALGCRKIVLSTNIAEAAVTIDDIVYVVDSGRAKVKSYDPYNNVSTLCSEWISKASAKQREGRAGRCQPGICYHLYSKVRASSLPDFQVPEIQSMRLEGLCLQVKLIDSNLKIEEFMQKLLDPPISESLNNALTILKSIGALTCDEDLTDLGEKMGSLPVHPIICKMLFYAILMNCLEPALTVACASDYQDPFIIPVVPSQKSKIDAAKKELASIYGGFSDHLAVLAAFEGWKNAKGKEWSFCRKYHLSPNVMKMLSGMCEQLKRELTNKGFITEGESNYNLNARDPGIVNAVLVAGLYPMVGKLIPGKNNSNSSVVETVGGMRVRLNKSSVNGKLSIYEPGDRPMLIYDEITRGDNGSFIRDSTIIGPLPVSLVATEIVVAPAHENSDVDTEEFENVDDVKVKNDDMKGEGKEKENGLYTKQCGKLEDANKYEMDDEAVEEVLSSSNKHVTVVIDRWLSFESTALDIAQIYFLRERLSAAILFKVKYPSKALPPCLVSSMHAIQQILSYDGLSGITIQHDDLLASKIDDSDPNLNPCPQAFITIGSMSVPIDEPCIKTIPITTVHETSSPVTSVTIGTLSVPIDDLSITMDPSDAIVPSNYVGPISEANGRVNPIYNPSITNNPSQTPVPSNHVDPPILEAHGPIRNPSIMTAPSHAPIWNNHLAEVNGTVNPIYNPPIMINPSQTHVPSNHVDPPISETYGPIYNPSIMTAPSHAPIWNNPLACLKWTNSNDLNILASLVLIEARRRMIPIYDPSITIDSNQAHVSNSHLGYPNRTNLNQRNASANMHTATSENYHTINRICYPCMMGNPNPEPQVSTNSDQQNTVANSVQGKIKTSDAHLKPNRKIYKHKAGISK